MLLGRSVWTRDARGWSRASFEEGGVPGSPAIARLADHLSGLPPGRTVVVFEPEGLAHQSVETPRVSRRVFASLERVRAEHPVVASEGLGWAVEHPEPAQGGTYSTLMHSELTPGLVYLCDACARGSSGLAAAWSAYTAAAACLKPRAPAPRARFVLILVPGFVAVAGCAGARRSFRGWPGPMADRDWKAFSALLGDFESRPSPSMADAGLRRGSFTVIADGEPEHVCPLWGEIRATGRLEAVVGLDALAAGASRIPVGHPANLLEAFPRPRQLNRLLLCTGAGCLAAAAALAAAVPGQVGRMRADEASSGARAAALAARLAELDRNQAEMDRLRSEAAKGPGTLPVGRHDALLGLAAAVPDSLTLTSLEIARDDAFLIEAIVVGPDFDADAFRRALERAGFKPGSPNGWSYDPASGRISARGRLAGRRQ